MLPTAVIIQLHTDLIISFHFLPHKVYFVSPNLDWQRPFKFYFQKKHFFHIFFFLPSVIFHQVISSPQQTIMGPDKRSMCLILKHEVPSDWRKLTACQSCLLCPVRVTTEQNTPWEETPGNPAGDTSVSHSKRPSGFKCLRNVSVHVCGWTCDLTVLSLSLMSQQCTQCACAFAELKYSNASVYRVTLHLQGVGLHCPTFALVFVADLRFSLVSKWFVFFVASTHFYSIKALTFSACKRKKKCSDTQSEADFLISGCHRDWMIF